MNNLFITDTEPIIKSTKKIEQITNEDDEDILKLILEKDKVKPKKEKRKTKKEMTEEQREILVERLKGMRATLAEKRAEKKKENNKSKPEEKQSTQEVKELVKPEVKELVKEPKQTKVSRANDKIDRLDAINNTLNKLLSYKEQKHKAAKKDTPEPILQIPTTEQPKLKEPEPTPTPEPPKPVQILPDIEEPPELPSFKSLNFNKFRR